MKKIVGTTKNKDFLKELSFFMMKSGAHPRRVSKLLIALLEIEFTFDYLTYDNYCENYVDSKLTELQGKLGKAQDINFTFGLYLVEKLLANSANNDALQNMVQPFLFSSLTKKGEGKNTIYHN